MTQMSKLSESARSAVNQAAQELIDKKVTTKLTDAATSVVSSAFAIVEDALVIVRDQTKKQTGRQQTQRS